MELKLFDFEPIPNEKPEEPKPISTCGKCKFQGRNYYNNSLIYCTLQKGVAGNKHKKVKSKQPGCSKFEEL